MVSRDCMQDTNKIYIFALAATGNGISGGDRIFIEFAKRWSKKNAIDIYTSRAGKRMCDALNLPSIVTVHDFSFDLAEYLSKVLFGIYLGLKLKIESEAMVYSASEFWMDSLPPFILKLRFPKIRWVAAWYQTAPNPIDGFSGGRYRFSALFYWLAQLPIKPLIANFADYVLVNNDSEKLQFPKLNSQNRAVVVLGAINLEEINTYILHHKSSIKNYDAVFQGRFHPQKGVVELIDIWKEVVAQMPTAKLVMIGDGPLMSDVRSRIKDLGLEKNIDLLGYVFDGDLKYKTFSQSKIVVHPALYDSGGMASAEAMAFGLPCVGFDLKAYNDYYPQGMIKVPLGDLKKFSEEIIQLLRNDRNRSLLAKRAVNMLKENWSWEKKAAEIYAKITR